MSHMTIDEIKNGTGEWSTHVYLLDLSFLSLVFFYFGHGIFLMATMVLLIVMFSNFKVEVRFHQPYLAFSIPFG